VHDRKIYTYTIISLTLHYNLGKKWKTKALEGKRKESYNAWAIPSQKLYINGNTNLLQRRALAPKLQEIQH